MEDTLDRLLGAYYFSKLNLKSGYWQVEIKEENKMKTAFSVEPLGFSECNKIMLFGFTNARRRFKVSCTFKEHLDRLEDNFQRLHEF